MFAMNCCSESGARDSELFGLADFNHQLAVTSHTCCIANLNKTHLDHAGWPGTDAVNTAHAEKVSST